jgi:hypothetical protein
VGRRRRKHSSDLDLSAASLANEGQSEVFLAWERHASTRATL